MYTDMLLDDVVLLTAILVIAQALYPNSRWLKIFTHGFPSTKSAKVCTRTVFYPKKYCYAPLLLGTKSSLQSLSVTVIVEGLENLAIAQLRGLVLS